MQPTNPRNEKNSANAPDWADEAARALHARLRALGLRVAVAESLTVGRVQAELGRWSGASAYFVGGVTCYRIDEKVRLLGVDAAHAEAVNAVSARVAEEMARGVARLFDCEIGVATTGYAEPDPTRGVEKPFAWVALSLDRTEHAVRVDGTGLDRTGMQGRVTAAALGLLSEALRGGVSPDARR